MNTFHNRLLMALAAFLALGAAFAGVAISGSEGLRSDLRRYASEQLQIHNYHELHISLQALHADYQSFLNDPSPNTSLDLREIHDGINKLVMSLRAEVERADKVPGTRYHPAWDGGAEAVDNQRLDTLVAEIRATLTAADAADALLRSGRTAEGMAYLEDTFNAGLRHKLDAMIAEGITYDEAEMHAMAEHVRGDLKFILYSGVGALVAVLAILAGTLAAVAIPQARSLALLRSQADSLAHGAPIDPAPKLACADLATVQSSILRAGEVHAQLRDERSALQTQLAACTATMHEEQAELRHIDQVRRDFLADVSHELRTPLTVVRGVAEVALRTESSNPQELKSAMSRIIDETGHVTRIVDDLFLIARSHAGALDLRTDIVDLTAVSESAAWEAKSLAKRARGRIAWRGVPRPVEVEGDEGRLRQLFTILVDNAFKYGGRTPSVEVDHRVNGESIVIEIRDHGPGVPEADLPYVFERLYRGPGSANGDTAGAGLGLALAKTIVEGHGGTISLSNANGGGALARVSLPIFDADVLEAEAS